MGEGAGILILESLEHARARGAEVLCELNGYGTSDDAYHISAPAENGAGAVISMKLALQDAGIEVTDIHYINAHGTSTPLNDKSETAAIKTVFGEQAYNVTVSSTKSMTGHLLGASGGIEAVFCVQAIRNNILPPTINYQTPDPECDLDYIGAWIRAGSSSRRDYMAEYLARYRVADLFLDTSPYNAGATASDALWSGVPVLTCLGETFAGRMGASLLTAIGLPELIATTLDQYESMAVDIATKPCMLAGIKQKLAHQRVSAPLFDMGGYARCLEAAYVETYERWQAGLPAAQIDVRA